MRLLHAMTLLACLGLTGVGAAGPDGDGDGSAEPMLISCGARVKFFDPITVGGFGYTPEGARDDAHHQMLQKLYSLFDCNWPDCPNWTTECNELSGYHGTFGDPELWSEGPPQLWYTTVTTTSYALSCSDC